MSIRRASDRKVLLHNRLVEIAASIRSHQSRANLSIFSHHDVLKELRWVYDFLMWIAVAGVGLAGGVWDRRLQTLSVVGRRFGVVSEACSDGLMPNGPERKAIP